MKRLRTKYDLTQEEFGRLFQIARPNVSSMEANEEEPTACWSAIFAYMDEYGIEVLKKRLE